MVYSSNPGPVGMLNNQKNPSRPAKKYGNSTNPTMLTKACAVDLIKHFKSSSAE
jgi:hypothetical protein